jgi:hypothetical protein
MSISSSDRIPFAKILIVLAVAFFIAIGLLWLAGTLPYPLGPDPREKFSVGSVGGVALIVGLLSAAGFVATIAAWVCVGVVAAFSQKEKEPQRLFSGEENKNKLS